MRDAQHNKLLAIPAALYAVNNYLKFAMQLYFKPTTAKMLGNLKVCLCLSACLAPCITMHASELVCLSCLSTLVMMPLHLRMQPLRFSHWLAWRDLRYSLAPWRSEGPASLPCMSWYSWG